MCSLIKGELQGHLDEGIWTHPLLLDKLLPIRIKRVHIHVQVSHQPAKEWGKGLEMKAYSIPHGTFLNCRTGAL